MVHLEEKKDKIIEDFNKGLSVVKLAKHYKCSTPTMEKHLKEWGVKK